MHFSQMAGMPSKCLDGSVFREHLKHSGRPTGSGAEVFSGAGIEFLAFESKWLMDTVVP